MSDATTTTTATAMAAAMPNDDARYVRVVGYDHIEHGVGALARVVRGANLRVLAVRGRQEGEELARLLQQFDVRIKGLVSDP